MLGVGVSGKVLLLSNGVGSTLLPLTATFSLQLYSEQAARTVAHGWCHRMHFFFSLWKSTRVDDYRFTDQDVAAYKELPEFAELARTSSGAQLVWVLKIRTIRPF